MPEPIDARQLSDEDYQRLRQAAIFGRMTNELQRMAEQIAQSEIPDVRKMTSEQYLAAKRAITTTNRSQKK